MEVEPAVIVWSGHASVSLVATGPALSGSCGKPGEPVSVPGTLLVSLGRAPDVEPGASVSAAPVAGAVGELGPDVELDPVVGVEPAPGALDGSSGDVGAVGGTDVAVGRAVSEAPLSPVPGAPGAAVASSPGEAKRTRAEAPHLAAGAARFTDVAADAATCAGAASTAGVCARAYAGTTTTAASNAAATVAESRRRVRILTEFIDT